MVVAGAIEPGYSEIRDAVSMLGATNAGHPWLFNVGVLIWGASFIAVAVALALDGPSGWRGLLGPALIAFTGVAQALDGFPFPLDCRRTIDAGCHARELAGQVPWTHVAHSWVYLYGAAATLLSAFAMAWRFRGDSRWGRADALALGAGLFGLLVFGGLFFATPDEPGGHYGLVQRLSLGAGGAWAAALALGLLAIHGRHGAPIVRLVERLRRLPGGELLIRPGSGAL